LVSRRDEAGDTTALVVMAAAGPTVVSVMGRGDDTSGMDLAGLLEPAATALPDGRLPEDARRWIAEIEAALDLQPGDLFDATAVVSLTAVRDGAVRSAKLVHFSSGRSLGIGQPSGDTGLLLLGGPAEAIAGVCEYLGLNRL
jgi:hypothetical protein